MAPRGKRSGGSGSVETAEPQAFHELGVRGRKTGALLRDTGERDEHGMQPLDAIFSSPHIRENDSDGDGEGSEDMDISSSGGPGPQTVLKSQRTIQNTAGPSSPGQDSNDDTSVSRKLDFGGRGSGDGATKSKANGKTRAPGLNGHGAFSRENSENIEAVMAETRQDDLMLDPDEVAYPAMETSEFEEERKELKAQAPTQAKKGRGRPPKTVPKPSFAPGQAPAPKAVPTKPTSKPLAKAPAKTEPKAPPKAAPKPVGRPAKVPSPEPSPEPEEPEAPEEDEEAEVAQEAEQEAEEEQELEPEPVKRKRGRPARDSQPQQDRPPPGAASKKRRSIEKDSAPASAPTQPEPDDETPRKKQRTAGPPTPKPEPPKPRGPGRPKAAAPAPTTTSAPPAAKPRGRGRPARKPEPAEEAEARADKRGDAEASFAGLSRAPPLPKSRGLVSVRKENTMTQTRSGRHSYRPVAYWRGEQVIQEVEEQDDMFNRAAGFVMPKIKEVVRVPLEGPHPRSAASRGRSSRPKPKKVEPEEEQQLEEWEVSPGVVEGEIVLWEPEHEEHPPADDEAVQVTDERIAISASAIQTSDIRDATFRFAKTLTMPFMGAGVVDLPPGGEKRPKNSRKMHMVFFVHTGKVMVTINEAQFRISAGGMWFVPRGNYYSITNDYDNPSRVFFCQACELSASFADMTQQSVA